jgi:hypothetical protein
MLDQGDLFASIQILEHSGPDSSAQRESLLLLSHGCEIEKPVPTLLCARVGLVAEIAKGKAGDLRRHRVANAMHLPASQNASESYVDFRHIYRVPRDLIDQAAKDGKRVASMTDFGRNALAAYLFRFITRREIPPAPSLPGQ